MLGVGLQPPKIRFLPCFLYFTITKMDELKSTLQIDEQNSNEDLDFFDALDDMNTYLDNVDDYDDID